MGGGGSVGVGVMVGVSVIVGVGVMLGVSVGDGLAVTVGLAEGVSVADGLGVAVGSEALSSTLSVHAPSTNASAASKLTHLRRNRSDITRFAVFLTRGGHEGTKIPQISGLVSCGYQGQGNDERNRTCYLRLST